MKYLIILFSLSVFSQELELEKPSDTIWYDSKPFVYVHHKVVSQNKELYLEKIYQHKDRTLYLKCRIEEVELLKKI